MKVVQRFIVQALERICTYVWDAGVVRFNGGAWLAYRVLRIPVCFLAGWSFALDQRWQTGYWRTSQEDEVAGERP
jgi:hypothetical protein